MGSGRDVVMQIVWRSGEDGKGREASHAGVWGRLLQQKGQQMQRS